MKVASRPGCVPFTGHGATSEHWLNAEHLPKITGGALYKDSCILQLLPSIGESS